LRVSYAAALRRVGGDSARPVLARADLAEIYARRVPLYAAAADIDIVTDSSTVAQVSAQIRRSLESWCGPRSG
ncbi:MAG: hypothetical protein LBQ06_05750, partial [Frankiaceae bacterium]|nr:hypothetical protein [Frankiaceae bacterium]